MSASATSPPFQAPFTQDYHQSSLSQDLHRPPSTSAHASAMSHPEPQIVNQYQDPFSKATNSKLEEILLGLKETRNNGFDLSWSETDSKRLIAEVLAEPGTSALVSAIPKGGGKYLITLRRLSVC